MNNLKTKFPLYIGMVVFVVSLLVASIKIGERTMMQTGSIRATGDIANFSLKFTSPDKITVYFTSTKEITGADFVILYNSSEIEIITSTLNGMSGYMTTGGERDLTAGKFIFSAVNTQNPLKNGFLATFNVKKAGRFENNSRQININFDANESKVYGINLEVIPSNFSGEKL